MTPASATPPQVVVAIFAGGESRRFDYQTKALQSLNGLSLLEHSLQRLENQPVHDIAICANHNKEIEALGYDCLEERHLPGAGPIRALLSAMTWCQQSHPDKLLLTVPCDTPLLPNNLVRNLVEAFTLTQAECVIAANNGRRHPTIGLWQNRLAHPLATYLTSTQDFSLHRWINRRQRLIFDFSISGHDPFININTPEELRKLQSYLAP